MQAESGVLMTAQNLKEPSFKFCVKRKKKVCHLQLIKQVHFWNTISYSLHVCVCVWESFSCVQPFATLRTEALQAPLSTGFSRQEYWSGLPCPPPGDLRDPVNETDPPTLQADSLPFELSGLPFYNSLSRNQNCYLKNNKLCSFLYIVFQT